MAFDRMPYCTNISACSMGSCNAPAPSVGSSLWLFLEGSGVPLFRGVKRVAITRKRCSSIFPRSCSNRLWCPGS